MCATNQIEIILCVVHELEVHLRSRKAELKFLMKVSRDTNSNVWKSSILYGVPLKLTHNKSFKALFGEHKTMKYIHVYFYS